MRFFIWQIRYTGLFCTSRYVLGIHPHQKTWSIRAFVRWLDASVPLPSHPLKVKGVGQRNINDFMC